MNRIVVGVDGSVEAHGETVEAAVAARPGVQVTTRAIQGAPEPRLLDAAEGAGLLVVGSRGRGGFGGLLLGSVSQQCVQHAPCPVVVVRVDGQS